MALFFILHGWISSGQISYKVSSVWANSMNLIEFKYYLPVKKTCILDLCSDELKREDLDLKL